MPIYEYICDTCGKRFEIFSSMKDATSELPCTYVCNGTGHQIYSFIVGKKSNQDSNEITFAKIHGMIEENDGLHVFYDEQKPLSEAPDWVQHDARKIEQEYVRKKQRRKGSAMPSDN